MAQVIPSKALWQSAAKAENVTAAKARDAANAARPSLTSIVLWLSDPAQMSGVDEAGFRAAWSELKDLDDAQVRAVMRVVATYADADYVA